MWADAVLLVHFAFIAFVVGGLLATIAGFARGWRWVRNPWFRGLHLAAIALVVLQAWIGMMCPLTVWESALRSKAGRAGYSGSFVAHWIQRIIYYDLPSWVFTLAYTLFAGLVVLMWILAPPKPRRQTASGKAGVDQRDAN